MQTVFAVSSAALFMVLPILISYRGNLSLVFFFVMVSIITASLISSLLFATFAQWRFKIQVLPTENEVREGLIQYIKQKKVKNTDNIQQTIIGNSIEQYGIAQQAREKSNNMRVRWIKYSMRSFYFSIFVCLVFFFMSIIIMCF